MECLWLFMFYKNYIVTVIMVCSLKRMCIPSFVLIGCRVSELCGYLCPYVWPEAVSRVKNELVLCANALVYALIHDVFIAC